MKAIIYRTVFAYIAAIIILVVFTAMIMQALDLWKTGSAEQIKRFTVYKPYSFDINDLIVDPDGEDVFDVDMQNEFYSGDDSAFCQNLRSCIETNLKGGNRCVISYEVKPDTPFYINSFKNSLNSCKSTIITDEIYGKTHRKVCTFNPITKYNELREDNLSISDYEPYLHNCYLPDNLGSLNVLGDKNSINYLYSGRGTAAGYEFENGGTVRIVVTNVSLNNDFEGTCSYSLYVCGQNAIAANETETAIQVFKKIQYLDNRELYFNETLYWAGQRPNLVTNVGFFFTWIFNLFLGSGGKQPPLPYNIYGYNPRYYDFDFSSSLPNKSMTLVDAVDAGMWEWNKVNYNNKKIGNNFISEFETVPEVHFSYYPLYDITRDSSISFDSGCWETSFEKVDDVNELKERVGIVRGSETFTDSESLKNIFNFNNFDIGEKIRMTLGIKKIFISDREYIAKVDIIPFIWTVDVKSSMLGSINSYYDMDLNAQTILVLDPITFCSE